jgi:hypothetical protein
MPEVEARLRSSSGVSEPVLLPYEVTDPEGPLLTSPSLLTSPTLQTRG